MELNTYIADVKRRKALAEALNTDPCYLWQLANSWRGKRPSPSMAQAIERESARLGPEVIPKASLRPDIWGEATSLPPNKDHAKDGQGS